MDNLQVAITDWIKDHPYLSEIARFQMTMAAVVKENSIPEQQIKNANINWGHIAHEIKKGIPVLKAMEMDRKTLTEAAGTLINLVDRLSAADLPEKTLQRCQQIQFFFHDKANLAQWIIAEVIKNNKVPDDMNISEIEESFIIFLVWNILSNILEPLQRQVMELLKDNQWRRGYCPICGQPPVMSHLVRTKKGRERELVCGCCQMRWRYKRIGCPYCGNDEQETLEIIEVAEEPDLRIDTCGECKCYLKTYIGKGNEQVILSDWSTLHLDLIGGKCGFKRTGYRMYGV